MFSRMQNIKLGKYFEDETQSLSDVEKILSKDTINIKLRENATTFRDLSDVIEDVANKWDKLSEPDQSATANAIAGRHYARTYSDIWGFA
jgi:GTP-binding protein EngB required for normal cell division